MTFSSSAVRIQGDDYQHLLAWYHALRALIPEQDVTGIEIEARDAGSLDDIVVRHTHSVDEYYQVKYSSSARHPIDNAWLTRKKDKGKSILEKFWASWQTLRGKGSMPRMILYTNRPLDVHDPVLELRDGRYGRLMPRLGEVPPNSDAGKRRKEWAQELGIRETELLEMLAHLEILTDQGSWSQLIENTSNRMAALGLRSDEHAVEQGWAAAHSWVVSGRRWIDREAIAAELERRKLHGGVRRATLAVQAIGWLPRGDSATASVDWVDLFEGDQPRARRQLRDPAQWNDRLWPELCKAEERIRGLNFDRVMVRGYMRLPVWFATGVAFADTRGFQVACMQGHELWTSEVEASEVAPHVSWEELGLGEELALGVSVTNDLSQDVLSHLRRANIPVGRFIHVASSPPNRAAIQGSAQAMGWAIRVREVVRKQVRETGARRLHLYLSGPAGLALFLGFLWNRVPTTQVYEDINPGYVPAFLIAS